MFSKKRKRAEQLRKELRECIDDAAYHFCNGNKQGYDFSVRRAALLNRQIKALRA